MIELAEHNQNLRIAYKSTRKSNSKNVVDYNTSLDEIDNTLRKVLSIEDMRKSGTFFTGDELAQTLVGLFKRKINKNSRILDPTCGAGNLLIACSRKLPAYKSLTKTLMIWGKVLHGYDLYPTFIDACKLRIILEAINNRGCQIDCNINKALKLLPNIIVRDALETDREELIQITHTILNPPFTLQKPTLKGLWKTGKVNASAVILAHYLKILPQGSDLSSILPEVLRSGTRYHKWRAFCHSTISGHTKVIGRFNSKTDVDVFILFGKTGGTSKTIDWGTSSLHHEDVISTNFEVSVGRLVAYRDPEIGVDRPFIHSKNVPLWSIIKEFPERRLFSGTAIDPPFVVIRRNSRPDDRYRAAASIIRGNEPVAVENHLIIIKPHSKTLKDCKKLLKVLKSKSTNEYLNKRIRCRHLTVEAVKQIPYFPLKE
ncbi:N-6 DNA methylase [Microbulbifer hainanensis]|uniref:N-6 DNA methylase n=1 Tax=Microbulbifer hainanensis TaxID=2735675 RepID=UPI001869637C|nr:N-6 DNA methylase [Microbulbifer hainanensis]